MAMHTWRAFRIVMEAGESSGGESREADGMSPVFGDRCWLLAPEEWKNFLGWRSVEGLLAKLPL